MTTTRSLTISEGDTGTAETVQEMGRLIREGALTPTVRNVAVGVVSGITDPLRQLLFLRSWVERNFQFVRDPASGELLHSADHLLQQQRQYGVARGDCDDAAILAGALACAVGFQVALITVAVSDNRPVGAFDAPLPFSHVWASASPMFECPDPVSGRQAWMEFDVTRPAQYNAVAHITRAQATLVC